MRWSSCGRGGSGAHAFFASSSLSGSTNQLKGRSRVEGSSPVGLSSLSLPLCWCERVVSATRGHKQHWDTLRKEEGSRKQLFRMLCVYHKILYPILNSSKCFCSVYCFQCAQVGNKPWIMNVQADRRIGSIRWDVLPQWHMCTKEIVSALFWSGQAELLRDEWCCHAFVPAGRNRHAPLRAW